MDEDLIDGSREWLEVYMASRRVDLVALEDAASEDPRYFPTVIEPSQLLSTGDEIAGQISKYLRDAARADLDLTDEHAPHELLAVIMWRLQEVLDAARGLAYLVANRPTA